MADVLVVGAGPVGLTMACELSRHGVRCRVVDRLPQPSPYCRALGVTPRTLEVGVVRPDGYVGWRGPTWRDAGLRAHLAQVLA